MIKICLKFVCFIISSLAIFAATVFISESTQGRLRQNFITMLECSDPALQPAILAARRSPFWKIPSRKDVVWGRLQIGEDYVMLLRPCRIDVNEQRIAVSLELWTILFGFCDVNEGANND